VSPLPSALRRPLALCLLGAALAIPVPALAAEVAPRDATTPLLAPATAPWLRDTGSGYVEVSIHATRGLEHRRDFATTAGPRRLRAVLRSRMSADQVGRLLTRDIQRSVSPGETARHVASLTQLGQAFVRHPELAAGQSFGFQFLPGRGTQLMVDEVPVGPVLGDEAFFDLLVRPWLGESAHGPARASDPATLR
jgi:Chalcone isomerase-like